MTEYMVYIERITKLAVQVEADSIEDAERKGLDAATDNDIMESDDHAVEIVGEDDISWIRQRQGDRWSTY